MNFFWVNMVHCVLSLRLMNCRWLKGGEVTLDHLIEENSQWPSLDDTFRLSKNNKHEYSKVVTLYAPFIT